MSLNFQTVEHLTRTNGIKLVVDPANKSIVYALLRAKTKEVMYIGKGLPNRPFDHERRTKVGKHYNIYLQNVIEKDKREGFGQPLIQIIADNLSDKDACLLEIDLIKGYGRKDINTGQLLNLTDGGDGASGAKRSAETKALMSSKLIGNERWKNRKNFSISEKQRSLLKANRAAQVNLRVGCHHSEETKAKLRLTQLGRKHTPEHVEKNRLHSIGNKNNLGKIKSKESKEKTRASMRAHWQHIRETPGAKHGDKF